MIGIKRRLRVSSAGADEAPAAFRAGEEARAASDPVRACDLFETAAKGRACRRAAQPHDLLLHGGRPAPRLPAVVGMVPAGRRSGAGPLLPAHRPRRGGAEPRARGRPADRGLARAGDRGGFAILSRAPAPALVPVRHAGCAPRGAPSIEKQSAVQFLDSPLYFPLPLANCPK